MLYNAALYQQKRTEAYANEKPIILCQNIIRDKNIIAMIQKSVPESCVYNQADVDPSCLKSSQLIIILGTNIGLQLAGVEMLPKTFRFVGKIISTKRSKCQNFTDNEEKIFYQKPLSFLGISIFAEHPTLTEIGSIVIYSSTHRRLSYDGLRYI